MSGDLVIQLHGLLAVSQQHLSSLKEGPTVVLAVAPSTLPSSTPLGANIWLAVDGSRSRYIQPSHTCRHSKALRLGCSSGLGLGWGPVFPRSLRNIINTTQPPSQFQEPILTASCSHPPEVGWGQVPRAVSSLWASLGFLWTSVPT